ncbi:hypothetical protein CD351_13075 [Erythrobacter sp. KY5]|uniref:DUF3617 domain-containing protein n=1 Tax=Erythrobacter sp. KY5 TaxID=2011159 RepID=UPI000DBF10F9|nr:DUF3617 domain-containing protein [Erythrobacter sp. KY5]AWW75362.1 hypothetical protein CD351_13075 [Erythrobacter sp. KY5]
MKAWLIGGALGAALIVGSTTTNAQIDAGGRPTAGQYRATTTFISIDMPGAPPQVADMMSQMMSNSVTYCLTEAEIAEGYRAITDRSTRDAEDCTYERFDYSGGKIDAVIQCRVDGQNMRMEMTGTGGATSSDMTMTMNGDFGMGDATIKLRSQHERIGECR